MQKTLHSLSGCSACCRRQGCSVMLRSLPDLVCSNQTKMQNWLWSTPVCTRDLTYTTGRDSELKDLGMYYMCLKSNSIRNVFYFFKEMDVNRMPPQRKSWWSIIWHYLWFTNKFNRFNPHHVFLFYNGYSQKKGQHMSFWVSSGLN